MKLLSAFTFLSLFVFLTATASADHEPIEAPAPQNPAPAPQNPAPAPQNPAPAQQNPTPAPQNPAPAPQNPTPAPQNPTPAPQNPALESSIESLIHTLNSGHYQTRNRAQIELSTMLNNPAQHAAVIRAVNLQLANPLSAEQRERLQLLKNTVPVNWETVMSHMRTAAQNSPVIARTRTAITTIQQLTRTDAQILQLRAQETQERTALRLLVTPLRTRLGNSSEPQWGVLNLEILRHEGESAARSAALYLRMQARLSEIMRTGGVTTLPGFTMAGGIGQGPIRLGDHVYNARFDVQSVSLTPVVAGPNGTFVPENIVVRRSDVLSDAQVAGLGLDPRTFTPSFNFESSPMTRNHVIALNGAHLVYWNPTHYWDPTHWSASRYETSARQLSQHFNTHRPAINAARDSLTEQNRDYGPTDNRDWGDPE